MRSNSARRRKPKVMLVLPPGNMNWESLNSIVDNICRVYRFLNERGQIDLLEMSGASNPLSQILFGAMSSDFIVFPICDPLFIKIFRLDLRVHAKLVCYFHGQSSVGFNEFSGFMECLQRKDVIVVASTAERTATRQYIQNAQIRVCPYVVHPADFPPSQPVRTKASSEIALTHFVYVGRLAPHKNIHGLILALFLLKKYFGEKNWKCSLIGEFDTKRPPELGVSSALSYPRYLVSLLKRLQLQDRVSFEGYRPQLEICETLRQERTVNVSLTLNEHENFGLAIAMALSLRVPTIYSAWGGHIDFQKAFDKKSMRAVPVHSSDFGPWIDPYQAAKELKRAIGLPRGKVKVPYSIPKVAKRKMEFLSAFELENSRKISFTPHFYNVNRQIEWFADNRFRRRVFRGFQDPLLRMHWESLGASAQYRIRKQARVLTQQSYLFVAKASLVKNTVEIHDPIKGKIQLGLQRRVLRNKVFKSGQILKRKDLGGLDSAVLHKLIVSGWIVPL